MSEVLEVELADADADADADAEGVGVGVGVGVVVDVLSPLVAVGLGAAVGLEVPEVALAGGLGDGLVVAWVICSHCCPAVAAARMASARAGDAVAVPKAMTDTLLRSVPPATRLIATGRTRVKHMEDVLPVLFVTLRNDYSV